jgi:hypothetical protein
MEAHKVLDGFWCNKDEQPLITLLCDHIVVVAQLKEQRNLEREKHIEYKYHLIRKIVSRGDAITTQPQRHNLVRF